MTGSSWFKGTRVYNKDAVLEEGVRCDVNLAAYCFSDINILFSARVCCAAHSPSRMRWCPVDNLRSVRSVWTRAWPASARCAANLSL